QDYWYTGATVTPGDGSPPRTMNALQAAVFVQSWLGQAFFGSRSSPPPPDVPISRLDVTGQWGQGQSGYPTVYYADDGVTVYLSSPNAPLTDQPADPPPPPEVWFNGQPRVRDAYAGTVGLLALAGTVDKPFKNSGNGTAASSSAPAKSSGSSSK